MSTILVVEDDTTVLETLSARLRSEGYDTLEAADGLSGLNLARDEKPDLIILDLMLPEMDGLSLCRTLRRQTDVPIIMLTARGTDMDKITGLETGADDYVVKPFSTGELLARVRSVLRRSDRADIAAKTKLQSGDLNINLTSRRAQRGTTEIHLTNKEFGLLTEFMINKGVVLSRDLLLTRVWGYDFLGNTHTVDVHVRWLREKVELDPSHPTRIITVRGVGYRFEA